KEPPRDGNLRGHERLVQGADMNNDTCADCGKQRKRGQGSATLKLCSTCYSRQWRANNRQKYKHICEGCGATFTSARNETRYCSLSCHNIYQSETPGISKERQRIIENGKPGTVRHRALKRARKAAKGTSGGNLIWVYGHC